MPNITDDMIAPELRAKAKSLRRGQGVPSPGRTRVMKYLCYMLRGKHGKGLRYEQIRIEGPGGGKLRICVYAPLKKKEGAPGLLWIHGGGFSIGVPEQDNHYIERFVAESGCVVVSPDYTLSIDRPYPAALEDCYAALLWLRGHGAAYGMREDQIFVGGDSAGGGLAAAVVLAAHDRGEAPVAFQILLYPMLDDRPTATSAENDAPVWNAAQNRAAWEMYLGTLSGEVPPYAAPARREDYAGLPPTVAYVGALDPLRAETEAYCERLRQAGVPVECRVFEGCFHAFDFMCPASPQAKEARSFLSGRFAFAAEHYLREG